MKAGAFTILLTAVMTSMSFPPEGSAEAAAGQAVQHEVSRPVELMSVAQTVGEVDVEALGVLLVRNDHALATAQIAMSKAISPAILHFARSRYDQEVVNRRKLVAHATPASLHVALSGPVAVQLHALAQRQRDRLNTLDGPAFELAYLSDGLQDRPLPSATPTVLFAGR